MTEKLNELKTVFVYDDAGFFAGTETTQLNPKRPNEYLFPANCSTVAPEFEDGFFYQIKDKADVNSAWLAIAKPTSAAEFIGVEIDHLSRSDYDNERRKILRSLVEKESDKYREKQINDENGNLLAITVEEIPEPTEEEKAAMVLAEAKGNRAAAVSQIVVSVERKNKAGKTIKVLNFDGDEEAQTRMSRTIVAAQALGVDLETETRTWVMADNSIEQVTISELAEALRLAGDAQTALWTIPYEG